MVNTFICFRMSWQGNHDIMVDRFDVRAHLDYIPEIKSKPDEDEELNQEERLINYERYRILAQNDFLGGMPNFVLSNYIFLDYVEKRGAFIDL